MRAALVNPAWSFDHSIYFGCREAHLPLELGYGKALLEQAQNAFVAADTALRNGDLAEYQRQIAVAQKAMDDALAQLNR